MRRVVVTGVGALSPLGNDWPTVFARLQAKQNAIQVAEVLQQYEGMGTRLAALAAPFTLDEKVYNRKTMRGMGRVAMMATRASEIALRSEPGATIRVVAGELFELTGPGSTHTPISYAHVTLAADASVTTALPAGHVVLGYPMTGAFRVGATSVDEGILAVLEGQQLTLTGAAATSEIILLTGRPIGEPVARYGPFVMNTEAELRQAFEDFENGTFGAPGD